MEVQQVERLHGAVTDLVDVLKARFNDHDLLIEMRTNQANLLGEVRAMRTEHTTTEADHERRIRSLERLGTYGLGALAVLLVGLRLWKG